jgi:predicted nuclease of predicted toxin-antitoxin system
MKAKLDENLPLRISVRLRELGHDVHTAQQENLSGCDDSELWAQAQREGRTLNTQDLDFSGQPALHAWYSSRVSCWFGCTHPAGCG